MSAQFNDEPIQRGCLDTLLHADDLPDNILPVVTLDLCPGRYRKPGERLPKPGQEGGVELEVEDEIIVQVHEHVSKHKHRKHRRML